MMNTCAQCAYLNKIKFERVASKVTKMVKRIAKCCLNMKKTKKNGNGLSSSYRSARNPSPSYVIADTSSDTSTDDSGIMLNPSMAQKKVIVTRAVIETRRPFRGPCSSSTPKKMAPSNDHPIGSSRLEEPSYITVIAPESAKAQKKVIVTQAVIEARRSFRDPCGSSTPKKMAPSNDHPIGSSRLEEPSYITVIAPESAKEPLEDRKPQEVKVPDDEIVKCSGDSDEQESPPTSLSRWRNIELSSAVCSEEEKFVVNLFQSRQSTKWKRSRLHVDSFEKSVHIIEDKKADVGTEVTGGDKKEEDSDVESDAMFYKLKKMRDAECVRMKEASNAMRAIRDKKVMEWADVLLTEKILLETDQKYQVIMNKIRDLKYSDWRFKEPKHSAEVKLSNFQYQLNWDPMRNDKQTEFFVLMLSHETDVIASKITRAVGEKLIFNETFTMSNVDDGFSIKAEVFSIKMNDSKSRMITNLLKKKTKTLCPIFRIYYENVNTNEVQESTILKSSFASCGTFIITKDHLDQTSGSVAPPPSGVERLQNRATFAMDVDLTVASRLSGFLTLGRADEYHNVVFWERKWCRLDGTLFTVYNYPQEEEFAKPPGTSIDLEFCLEPLGRPSNVPKKYTFVLKTGRPSIADDGNIVALRRKNNFVLEKYYFYADNRDDFEMWTGELDSILASLKEWKRLIFADEDY